MHLYVAPVALAAVVVVVVVVVGNLISNRSVREAARLKSEFKVVAHQSEYKPPFHALASPLSSQRSNYTAKLRLNLNTTRRGLVRSSRSPLNEITRHLCFTLRRTSIGWPSRTRAELNVERTTQFAYRGKTLARPITPNPHDEERSPPLR